MNRIILISWREGFIRLISYKKKKKEKDETIYLPKKLALVFHIVEVLE